MTTRALITLAAALGGCAMITLSDCGPRPQLPWRPPLRVALPDPTTPPPAARPLRQCADWSEVRGGPLRQGRSYCPGLRQAPAVRWSVATGAPVIASPVVRGQHVYVASTNGRVHALDRTTGRVRWVFEAGSPIQAAPALLGTAVLVGATDGRLHCLEARTGQVRWTHQSRHAIHHAPAAWGTQVLVGDADGTLTALDVRTGLYRWSFYSPSAWRPSQKGGYTLAGIAGPPARAGDVLYFGSVGGHVYALAAATGELHWDVDTHRSVASPPAVAPDQLLVTDTSGYLHALSRVDGDRLTGIRSWYDQDVSAPTLGDGLLYVATGTALLGLAPSGYVRWKHPLAWGPSRLAQRAHPAPVLAGNVVYLNDRLGRLWAVDAVTGQLLWKRTTARGAFSAPAPVTEGLLVGSGDGRVYLLAGR